MKPTITIDLKGQIISAWLLSGHFLTFLKKNHKEIILPLIQELEDAQCRLLSKKLLIFEKEISIELSFSNNLYTLKFENENDSMSEGPSQEKKYKLIVEAANEIIYEADPKGNFTYVNPKTLELTGYQENEILGKSYLELIHPDHREAALKFYGNQVVNNEQSSYREVLIVTKSGDQFWIGLNVQLLETEFEVTGFLGVGRDITESYENRLALQQSEEKYRGIIQNLQYGLLEVDLNEKIVFANEAMTKITGFQQSELIGKIASKLLADERAKTILDKQHSKREEGGSGVYEIPIRHKDGGFRWAMISGAPIYNTDGSIRGTIGIHMDITERIEAEKELKITRTKLKKYKDGLEALNSVTSNLSLSSSDQIEEGLKVAKQFLGLDLAIISEIEDKEYRVKHFVSKDNQATLQIGDVFNLGDTFCELVLKENDIIHMRDVSQSKHADHPCHDLFGIESYLGVSYNVNGELRGTVNFSSAYAREIDYDSYDLEFINLFSKWIGYTITLAENREKLELDQKILAEKNQELENNQQYLGAINQFVTSLLDDESISEIAWEIAENIIDKFGYEDCVIYIFNEEKKVLEQVAAYGPKQSKDRNVIDPIIIQLNEGIVGSVAASGQAEIISDTRKDPRYVVDDAVRLSEITVPILADGKVIGVIDSEHQNESFFNESHLNTLTTIGNLAANRLKNALAKRQQEKAERELIESEQKLRKILHNAIDAVITIDDQGIILEWNRQAELIFGFMAEETIGKTLTETIIPGQHRKSHDQGMKHFNKTGEGPVLNQKIEITALRKTGEEFPIEMAIIPIEDKGKHTFTAFLSDITIQKQVQTEMEKALNKERELNELKSRFVSMTSHEFRTPLTTIKQNTDLISYQLESERPEDFPRYKKYIDRIDGDLNRVTSLMNDILMLGRIEAGRIQMKKKPVDFVQFIDQLVRKYLDNDKEGRAIEMKVKGVPREVEIDFQLMDHVVSNLISNALKYSPGGKAPEVDLSFNQLSKVTFSIKDFGIGIPQKDLKSLFESFYRANNVKNIQGSGLGLSIVKEFTEMHGGQVFVESEEGKGSQFTIEIPYS